MLSLPPLGREDRGTTGITGSGAVIFGPMVLFSSTISKLGTGLKGLVAGDGDFTGPEARCCWSKLGGSLCLLPRNGQVCRMGFRNYTVVRIQGTIQARILSKEKFSSETSDIRTTSQ